MGTVYALRMRALTVIVFLSWLIRAQDPPPAPVHYLGRRIATTMSYHGAGWLTRPEREQEERASKLLEALAIKPGWTVADLGCGNGFHALPMAKMVGESGRILAVDIQPQMLKLLERRAKEAGVEDRITPILATATDPKLPPNSVDLLIMVDVYHEISHPEQVLAHIRRALKPGGRAVWVEFRTEDVDVPIKPEHKMSKLQVKKEAVANGFRLVRSFDELPWQHVLFFERDDAWKPRKPIAVEPFEPHARVAVGGARLGADQKAGSLRLETPDGRRVDVRPERLSFGKANGFRCVSATKTPVTLTYETSAAPCLTMEAQPTFDGGIDVILHSPGVKGDASGSVELTVSVRGEWLARQPLHRIGPGRDIREGGLPWVVDPSPELGARRFPIDAGGPWPLFGIGRADRCVAIFVERPTAVHRFSLLQEPTGVTLVLRQRRVKPKEPFGFRFHVALPKATARTDLVERYEAWSQEKVK